MSIDYTGKRVRIVRGADPDLWKTYLGKEGVIRGPWSESAAAIHSDDYEWVFQADDESDEVFSRTGGLPLYSDELEDL